MIYLVNGADSERHADWLEQMYRIRAKVFADRLKWDVRVTHGLERDEFDDVNPLYLLSVDDRGRVRGTLRLLPTTGPNMLRDVFHGLLDQGQSVESPIIWEASRFAVDPDATTRDANTMLNPITCELLCGMIEVGLMAGLDFITAVVDARMKRILHLAGYPLDIIGTPQRLGVAKAYAGLLEVSEATWQSVASRGSFGGRVLSQDSQGSAVAA